MKEVSVHLLGRFAVAVDGAAIPGDAWRSRRAAEVVKLLALTPGHRMHRAQLIDALWPDSDAQAGGANLRKALHFARSALGDDQAIVTEHDVLVLWPSAALDIDMEHFAASAREALEAHDPDACVEAARLYSGELLPDDRYESWLVEPRARLRQRYLDLLRNGRQWDRLADEDPTDEQAARELMRRHLEAGQRREAMRRFERLREALHEQLGVGPDRDTISLYEDVLAAEGAPKPSAADRAHALLAWALVHMSRNDIAEAERAAEEARTIALENGLGRELGEAAVILAKVAMAQGRWRERFAEELVESMRLRADLEPIVYDAHLCFAEYYLAGPEGHDIAANFARQMLQVADEAGSPTGAALATLMLGEAELLAGHIDEAEHHLKTAAEGNDRQGCISGSALSRQRLAEAAVIRGRNFDANRLLDRARSLAHRSDLAPHLLVRVHGTKIQAAPDPRGASIAVRAAEQELNQMRSCEPCSMSYLTSAAIASARVGQLERAQHFLTEAERIAGMWQGGMWTAAVWEARGVLRQAEGETEQARAMLREAASAFANAGRQRDAARCRDAADVLSG